MKVTYGDDGIASYAAMQGDVLDAIAFRFYGTHEGTTELLLEANPGISEEGLVLAVGRVVRLPAIAAKKEATPLISLWD